MTTSMWLPAAPRHGDHQDRYNPLNIHGKAAKSVSGEITADWSSCIADLITISDLVREAGIEPIGLVTAD
jgi:hypothetical protein